MKVDCDKSCILKDIFQDSEQLQKHCKEVARKRNQSRLDKLRPMELKLLPYFGNGYLTKEIAIKFHISESTVKSHKRNAIKNLGLKNGTEFICFILKCGFI